MPSLYLVQVHDCLGFDTRFRGEIRAWGQVRSTLLNLAFRLALPCCTDLQGQLLIDLIHASVTLESVTRANIAQVKIASGKLCPALLWSG